MTLTAFYDCIGSDYNTVLHRMGNSERMVDKFVKKFLNDTTADQLFDALNNKDYETAFRMAHTLKGVCLNLGFDKLMNSSSELTEALRNEVADNVSELLENVQHDYAQVMGLLKELE